MIPTPEDYAKARELLTTVGCAYPGTIDVVAKALASSRAEGRYEGLTVAADARPILSDNPTAAEALDRMRHLILALRKDRG